MVLSFKLFLSLKKVMSIGNRREKKTTYLRNSGNQTPPLDFIPETLLTIESTFRIQSYFISLFLPEEKCSVFQKSIKCHVQE